jgi:ATP-dependent DNA helicase RecG
MRDLDELLRTESDRVEWKTSDREALQAVCALANDLGGTGRPGYLLLGVDKSGAVVGVDASDEAQKRLASRLRSTKIWPQPSVSIEALRAEGHDILVLEIEPYPVPPVVQLEQVAWVRIGTTTHRASEADQIRLRERRPEGSLPFDLQPVADASIADLDLASLRQEYAAAVETDFAAETFPDLERWLAQRNLVRFRSGTAVPTVAGLLVFGLDPQAFLPAASIELVRFAGNDPSAPVAHRKTITGSLPHQLEAVWTQLKILSVDSPTRAEGMRSPYRADYPLEALRELARNLVQHRIYQGTNAPSRISWYDDRIVFLNPGARFGRASEGEFGAHSDYRNPTVTGLLVQLGYVERLGRGVQLARVLLERNGNPPLEVETNGYTSVTVKGVS